MAGTAVKVLALILVVAAATTYALNVYSASQVRVAYHELSFYSASRDETQVAVRVYIANPTPAPYYLLNVTLSLRAGGQSYTAHLGDAWINGKGQLVYEVNAHFRGRVKGPVNVTVSYLEPVYVFYLFELYSTNHSETFPLDLRGGEVFLWAGWNTTVTRVNHCVTVEARSSPLTRITVLVYEDLTGRKDDVVKSFEGLGTVHGVFCPTRVSGLNLKGYYLKVSGGGYTWIQPDSYPPRLTVTP